MELSIDFESRSAVDLPSCGMYVYAEHPSTDIMMLSVKVDDEPSRIWYPGHWLNKVAMCADFEKLPLIEDDEALDLVEQADVIEAHNAGFEKAMWHHIMHKRWGYPDLPFEKIRCSAATAARLGLPRALGQLARAIGVKVQKDDEGYAIMMKLCKPRAPRSNKAQKINEWADLDELHGDNHYYQLAKDAYDTAGGKGKLKSYSSTIAYYWREIEEMGIAPHSMLYWNEEPEDVLREGVYCLRDTDTERAVSNKMRSWPGTRVPEAEERLWRLDNVINERGFMVDVPAAKAVVEAVDTHKAERLKELTELTDGLMTSAKQYDRQKTWLKDEFGIETKSVSKTTIAEMKEDGILPPKAVKVFDLIGSLGKAATAKYEAAIRSQCHDGRVRGTFLVYGAGTWRWAGKGIQPHNFFRGDKRIPTKTDQAYITIFEDMRLGPDWVEMMYPDLMLAAACAIRGVIKAAPGKKFYCSDFSSVEGRVLAWCADEKHILDGYIAGLEMYKLAAAGALGKSIEEITEDERQNPGKPLELGCGYQGSVGAVKQFGGKVPDAEWDYWLGRARADAERKAEREGEPYIEPDEEAVFVKWALTMVRKWRKNRPATVALWKATGEAAIEAVKSPGKIFAVAKGKVKYRKLGPFLFAKLPSGRCIPYYDPRIIVKEDKWGRMKETLTYMGMKQVKGTTTTKWTRVDTYGGKLVENCLTKDTQVVTARGVLPIVEVLAGDRVWDGEKWVTTRGPVEKGEQEVGEWLGIRITQDHLIYDGSSWNPVIDLDESATLDSLKWARLSVLSELRKQDVVMMERQLADVRVAGSSLYLTEPCSEGMPSGAAPADGKLLEQSESTVTSTERSSRMNAFSTHGSIDILESSADAMTQTIGLIKTTEREVSGSLLIGSMIVPSSCDTRLLSQDGMNSASTSTESTMRKAIAPETSDSLLEKKIPTTSEVPPFCASEEKLSRSLSSGRLTALSGRAETPSGITSTGEKHRNRSWTSTGQKEPVYDLLNCGPDNRFTVITNEGPVVVHNCVQAISRDLLRDAMFRVEDAGYPIVLHVHDENLVEVDEAEDSFEEFNAIMGQVPDWAHDLPLAANGWEGYRYKK